MLSYSAWANESSAVGVGESAVVGRVSRLRVEDVLVFGTLELLATLAFVGNSLVVLVVWRYQYLARPSFVLIFSLACADLLHAVVTSVYFYPPIILKSNYLPLLARRLFNLVDWTAWAVTVTHMSAICIDRLVAISWSTRYQHTITVKLVRRFSVSCWLLFGGLNCGFFLLNFCCMVSPQPSSDFYSFDYAVVRLSNSSSWFSSSSSEFNVYPLIYIPLEVACIVILAVGNPIMLLRLWQRHKRKTTMRRASELLVQMSRRMSEAVVVVERSSVFQDNNTSPQNSKSLIKTPNKDARRQQRQQQQRAFFNITTVTLIFFLYMFVYYLFFYLVQVRQKWAVVFNSLFYSTTHMINPVVYFSLNKTIRANLIDFLKSLTRQCQRRTRRPAGRSNSVPRRQHELSTRPIGLRRTHETSPLIQRQETSSSERILADKRRSVSYQDTSDLCMMNVQYSESMFCTSNRNGGSRSRVSLKLPTHSHNDINDEHSAVHSGPIVSVPTSAARNLRQQRLSHSFFLEPYSCNESVDSFFDYYAETPKLKRFST